MTASASVLDDALLLELYAHHVLRPGEQVDRVTRWPGRVGALVRTTAGRADLVAPSAGLRLREAPWVDEVVVAEPMGDCASGRGGERAFVVFHDGRSLSLSDPGAVAYLAGALHSGLDPVAYAEVLVRWHPWSAARRGLVLHPGELREQAGRRDLPDLPPPVVETTETGRRLRFSSWSRYARVPGGRPHLDAVTWAVDVPYEGLARWTRSLVLEGVPAGEGRRGQPGVAPATSR